MQTKPRDAHLNVMEENGLVATAAPCAFHAPDGDPTIRLRNED
jgi:hypothetical protein